jgi:cysteine-rich repeat protein
MVLDLGGIHDAATGSFTLNANTVDVDGNNLNLVPGKVYQISIFQAERNPGGSSYKLELSGFNRAPSLCLPVCGDGQLALGEQCDDGENLGGYGKCAPGCVLTEYCGDAIKQQGEDCDDGNRDNDDDCNNACRNLIVK